MSIGRVNNFNKKVNIRNNTGKYEILLTEEFDQVNSNLNSNNKEKKFVKNDFINIDSYSDKNLNNSTNHKNSNSNINTLTTNTGNLDSPLSNSPSYSPSTILINDFKEKKIKKQVIDVIKTDAFLIKKL